MEKGIRVGAVMNADENGVKFFGWGTYQGHEVPGPEVAGFMGHALRENKILNPKILLDSGKVVWGCECWWGPEAEVTKMIGGRKIEEVDIEAIRAAMVAEAEVPTPEAKA